MAKLNKKGELAKTEDETPVLVNDKKQAYKINRDVIDVWEMCDGTKTEEEISTTLTEKIGVESDKVRKFVSEVVPKLKEAELIA